MKLSKTNKMLIALGVLVVATGVYFLLTGGSNDDDIVMVEEGMATGQAQSVFVDLAAQLDPVAFDTSVLSDPRFLGLQDIHTAIVPEIAGRVDPFASLFGSSKAR